MSDQEEDEVPGDSEEVKATKRVVRITADLLGIAAQVIEEMDRRDGKEFSTSEDQEPTLQEMCGVATLIMTGRMSGIYLPKKETPEETGPSLRDPSSLMKSIESLVKSEVMIAMSRAERRSSVLQPVPVLPPPPRYEIPPIPPMPKSDLIEVIEKMGDRLERCGCLERDHQRCGPCERTLAANSVLGEFLKPEDKSETNFRITCGCGGIMRVYWRPDGSRGIQCEKCQEGGRGQR
jgi:hypothetical protein